MRSIIRLRNTASISRVWGAWAESINSPTCAAMQLVSNQGDCGEPCSHECFADVRRPSPRGTSRYFSVSARTFASQNDTEGHGFGDIVEAFQALIDQAYSMLAQGQPLEAESLLDQGVRAAEDALGKGSLETAPLYDQLALVRFLTDRCEEAVEPAQRALEVVQRFALVDGSDEASAAANAAAVRHASTLVGSGKYRTAFKLLEETLPALETAISRLAQSEAPAGSQASDEQLIGKFETSLGEGRFYLALCELADSISAKNASVSDFGPRLEESLELMARQSGLRHPLTACALRELNRLTEAALDAGKAELAESLFLQQLRLHSVADPDGEQLLGLHYQLGTLQYCMGGEKLEAAVNTLTRAVQGLEREFEGGEDAALMVKHRLGMALGALGRHKAARQQFAEIAESINELLGPSNPATTELEFMSGLMDAKEALERGENSQMGTGQSRDALQRLEVYGKDHMLVKASKSQLEEVELALAQGRQA
jgi:tetratricopeptide (TPR) repeat protein